MAEVQDRRLVGDRIVAEFKPGERTHRLDVVERFLRARIGQVVPLLQAVDAQHRRKRERPTATLRSELGIMRLDQRFELRPRHNRPHLGKENIALRALLLCPVVE
jgi:hypothetical protein